MPKNIPNERQLDADLVAVKALHHIPFGRFLNDQELTVLVNSPNRSILASTLRRKLDFPDKRIRFVEASASYVPKGTMKLFGVDKAIRTPLGMRLQQLLDGGVVAVTVMKPDRVRDWCIVGTHTFLPAGAALDRAEADLEILLRQYLRHPVGKLFNSTTVGSFQLRTGPSLYSVYLDAQKHFSNLSKGDLGS